MNAMTADDFDLTLAIECADAFSKSTGLGCTVSNVKGILLHTTGAGCGNCQICKALNLEKIGCIQAHAYGMTEAERFGGKYIYFCPMGLTCFVSPIMGCVGSAAKITVGPFLMVDLEDYAAFELQHILKLKQEQIQCIIQILGTIPYVPPDKVNALSNLLFMSVSFMNNVSVTNRMLDDQDTDYIQGQVSDYIRSLKTGKGSPQYPLETERKMMDSIEDSDKKTAQRLLNELLGFILFSSGGDLMRIKAQIYELLVLISRAAIDAGAPTEESLHLTQDFFVSTQQIENIDDLCFELAKTMNQLIDNIFSFCNVKNADIMYKAFQCIKENYAQKLTLDNVAKVVHLSPSYFSKMFKLETGETFNRYLNIVRIEKSKKLLLYRQLPIVEIAAMVGFEEQSYFTKVFKRITGMSPCQYRKSGGHTQSARQITKIGQEEYQEGVG